MTYAIAIKKNGSYKVVGNYANYEQAYKDEKNNCNYIMKNENWDKEYETMFNCATCELLPLIRYIF